MASTGEPTSEAKPSTLIRGAFVRRSPVPSPERLRLSRHHTRTRPRAFSEPLEVLNHEKLPYNVDEALSSAMVGASPMTTITHEHIDRGKASETTEDGAMTAAANEQIGRGRASEVDAILHQLGYPPVVVKVVAEYNPTTRASLLAELKKEVARMKWSLGMRSASLDILIRELREIEKSAGMEPSTNPVVMDLEDLASEKQLEAIFNG